MKTWIGIGASFAVAVALGALHYADANAVLQFVVGIVALALLAWTVGVGTEVVAARFGPATTGVLQSTLGNLPELFIVIFALRAGEIVVAQTSILGSLLANALLVLGLAIIAGAWRVGGRRDALPDAPPERHDDAAHARRLHHRDHLDVALARATRRATTRRRSR